MCIYAHVHGNLLEEQLFCVLCGCLCIVCFVLFSVALSLDFWLLCFHVVIRTSDNFNF